MTKKELISLLEEEGYTNIREIDGKLCGLFRYMFTVGLVVDMNEFGYRGRFCYENRSDALEALNSMVSVDEDPAGPWIKYKGEGGERSNTKLYEEV